MKGFLLPVLLLLGGCMDFLGLAGPRPDTLEVDTGPSDTGTD